MFTFCGCIYFQILFTYSGLYVYIPIHTYIASKLELSIIKVVISHSSTIATYSNPMEIKLMEMIPGHLNPQ